ADVRAGTGARSAPVSAPASGNPLADVRISALDDTARVDVLIDRIGTPDLTGVDLDGVIDDTRVSIVALADLLGSEDLAEVRAAIDAGGAGRDELLAAIEASVELGAVLNRNGLSRDDVVSLSIDADGGAELVVLDLDVDLADAGSADAPLLDTDLAALDVD